MIHHVTCDNLDDLINVTFLCNEGILVIIIDTYSNITAALYLTWKDTMAQEKTLSMTNVVVVLLYIEVLKNLWSLRLLKVLAQLTCFNIRSL